MPGGTIEPAVGPVDSHNRDFSVSVNYETGTLRVWENGILLSADFGEFQELGGKNFRTSEAPRTGSTISAFFIPL